MRARRAVGWMIGVACVWIVATTVAAQEEGTPQDSNNLFGQWVRPLREVEVGIQPPASQVPPDQSANVFASARAADRVRRGVPQPHFWAASELVSQPVYFDDVILERYGQTLSPRLQPLLSGAHFFGTFPIVPYKIGIDRTHDLISTLGYYRPGSPTPRLGRRLPWETDAALFETGAWLGLIFIFP